jgi:uncharacterized iron-regulated protein
MIIKDFLKCFALFLLVTLFLSGCFAKKITIKPSYTIYNSNCITKSFEELLVEAQKADVVLFGESHNDRVAHELQIKILKSLHKQKRELILSLEMFERDTQIVLNEYLNDLITERHFIRSARAWGNYRSDYKPLIEFSKKNSIKVVAANAPRRYVNLVARKGTKALKKLSDQAKKWIAPLPYKKHNVKYIKKIEELNKLLMKKLKTIKTPPLKFKGIDPDAQRVWDITMAHSIVEQFKKSNPLVFHINGKFHSEDNMGIPDFLRHYKKDIKILIITAISKNDMSKNIKDRCMKGDFVIVTTNTF